ncbi:MAG: hypothetical protein MZU97_05505 [Bacillus subtilis]|nr:hypothetical protein [Bacillus subtilis]
MESSRYVCDVDPTAGYVGTLVFAEAISTAYGFLPLDPSSELNLDFLSQRHRS